MPRKQNKNESHEITCTVPLNRGCKIYQFKGEVRNTFISRKKIKSAAFVNKNLFTPNNGKQETFLRFEISAYIS